MADADEVVEAVVVDDERRNADERQDGCARRDRRSLAHLRPREAQESRRSAPTRPHHSWMPGRPADRRRENRDIEGPVPHCASMGSRNPSAVLDGESFRVVVRPREPRVAVDEHERTDALGMTRLQRRWPSVLRAPGTTIVASVDPGSVEHGDEVVHPRLHGDDTAGQPRWTCRCPACRTTARARSAGEASYEIGPSPAARRSPRGGSAQSRHEDDVAWPRAEHLVGNVHVPAADVLRRRERNNGG